MSFWCIDSANRLSGILFALILDNQEAGMKCYFYGTTNSDDPSITTDGVVSFAIPDTGIVFKSRWVGNQIECQYAALLSLLRFI